MNNKWHRAKICGLGHYLPEHIVANDDFPKELETSDEWIVKRTGIKRRHFVKDGETCADLAIKAGRSALAMAEEQHGIKASDIDLVMMATSTPDDVYPATAGKVMVALGIPAGPFFDLQAVCAGFTYGLFLADSLIKSGAKKNILLIGADVNSAILDKTDRSTFVLFGDGAGAMVISAGDLVGAGDVDTTGILVTRVDGAGEERDKLFVDGGIVATGGVGKVRMKGQDVYRYAVEKMSSVVADCLGDVGLAVSDIDWYIPHQANLRIMDAVCGRLGLDMGKVVVTVEEHANISSATIPVAMSMEREKLRTGDLLAMSALGGGLVWGGALVRW